MNNRFFVILTSQDGESGLPLVDDNNMVMFETTSAAITQAENNPLGQTFGYDIYKLEEGSSKRI